MSLTAAIVLVSLAGATPGEMTSKVVVIGSSEVALAAPNSWWGLRPEQRLAYSVGCGPDTISTRIPFGDLKGVSLAEACSIHDYMYSVGGSERSRKNADKVLVANFRRIVAAKGDRARFLRRSVVESYYLFVRTFGWMFFSYY